MKLYYAPGACSLSDHIALAEGGAAFDIERIDLKTKITASGVDFRTVNAKGYVPALVLDDGEVITENVAVLVCSEAVPASPTSICLSCSDGPRSLASSWLRRSAR